VTDAAFMLSVLEERPGEWVAQTEILQRSMAERGCGLTVHSRAATLRGGGHTVENKIEKRAGRAVSFYRLVTGSLAAAAPVSGHGPAGASAASGADDDPGQDGTSSLFQIPASARSKEPAWS